MQFYYVNSHSTDPFFELCFLVLFGSQNEKESSNGTAHMIEHLLFRRLVIDYDTGEKMSLFRLLNKYTIKYEAKTTWFDTQYRFICPLTITPKWIIKIIFDAILNQNCNPYICGNENNDDTTTLCITDHDKNWDGERNVILNEYYFFSKKLSPLLELVYEKYFSIKSDKKTIIGSAENIKCNITNEIIAEALQYWYNPKHVISIVVVPHSSSSSTNNIITTDDFDFVHKYIIPECKKAKLENFYKHVNNNNTKIQLPSSSVRSNSSSSSLSSRSSPLITTHFRGPSRGSPVIIYSITEYDLDKPSIEEFSLKYLSKRCIHNIFYEYFRNRFNLLYEVVPQKVYRYYVSYYKVTIIDINTLSVYACDVKDILSCFNQIKAISTEDLSKIVSDTLNFVAVHDLKLIKEIYPKDPAEWFVSLIIFNHSKDREISQKKWFAQFTAMIRNLLNDPTKLVTLVQQCVTDTNFELNKIF